MQSLVVKNTNKKVIESSNSTTMFRNINRERFQIRRGKILEMPIENLKTKSSNLIILSFQEEANLSNQLIITEAQLKLGFIIRF